MAIKVAGPRPKVNAIDAARPRLSPERKVKVRAPDGHIEMHTISNARDLERRRAGWKILGFREVNPVPSISEQTKAQELEDARALLRAAGELPEPGEEEFTDDPPAAPVADESADEPADEDEADKE